LAARLKRHAPFPFDAMQLMFVQKLDTLANGLYGHIIRCCALAVARNSRESRYRPPIPLSCS